jgi:NAD(P)-dependent dehydrogenase (short-subunit alcohol dehydrogenase family)
VKRLEGRTAIITGGAGTIGAASAARLVAEGANVVVADIRMEAAQAVAHELDSGGSRVIAVEVDLAEESSIKSMIDSTIGKFGRLDVLHNNAGATERKQLKADQMVTDMEAEVWDTAMRINARAPMLACKHAIPKMLETGGGSIINTASIAGLRGDAVRTAYGCSKAALIMLTVYVASSFGRQGIRCNAISPGLIMNPAIAQRRGPEVLEKLLRHYASPRLGEGGDVAALVAYLASDESAFVNGQNISVDGAMSMHLPSMGEYV